MGSNFHTPWTTSTIFKTTSMCPALASLDKGITYLKNIIVHTDGSLSYNKTTGVLTWSSVLRILFVREDGQAIQNTVNAGNITLADNEFAYVDLNETNNTVLTVSKAAVTTGSASNFKAVNRLVLAYRNTISDELFPVYLSPYLLNIPIEESKGGTGLTSLDTLIRTISVSLSNADIKALRATPKTLIATPGTNKTIEFISGTLRLIAGSEALTEVDDNLAIKYTNGSGVQVSNNIETTGFIDQVANTLTNATRKTDTIVAETGAANQALVLHNIGDAEFAGNASNNATMVVKIAYRINDFS